MMIISRRKRLRRLTMSPARTRTARTRTVRMSSLTRRPSASSQTWRTRSQMAALMTMLMLRHQSNQWSLCAHFAAQSFQLKKRRTITLLCVRMLIVIEKTPKKYSSSDIIDRFWMLFRLSATNAHVIRF